jgi:hypothetical protein
MNPTKSHRSASMIAAGLGLGLGLGRAGGGASALPTPEAVRVKQDLSPTGADPDARGKLRFLLKGPADGRLVIRIGRLARRSGFEVLADGVKVGALTTTGGGSGRLRFRSDPGEHDLLLGFDPRGRSLVVRNEDGDDVLAVTVTDDSIDPDEIACCIPDDDGSECEDRTAAECEAAGGTITESSSCLPNPCPGAPGPDDADVVCCIPDDSGPECEDRTVADCAAQGGTVVDATSCAPDPCAGTPPADDEIACCVPHDTPGEPDECETETPTTCTALGGTPADATICQPDTCGGSDAGEVDEQENDRDDDSGRRSGSNSGRGGSDG